MSKFKINDEVLTEYGRGVIVYLDVDDDNVPFLVKIEGFDGHGGLGLGYTNPDGMRDKWWFCEDELTLIEKEENKYEVGDLVRVIRTGNYQKGQVLKIEKLFDTDALLEEGWITSYENIEPVTHLTTKEFIKLVEDMGYEVNKLKGKLQVAKDDFSSVAFVGLERLYDIDTLYNNNCSKELFKILTLYAKTPLELRDEKEQLYTLELPNNKHKNRFYCHQVSSKNYSFGKLNPDVNRQPDHIKHFTQKEIDELPNQELIKTLKQEPVK